MSDKKPKVSVVIPAFNVQNYIVKALDSALNQTRKPDAIVVVEDGSTDRTAVNIAKRIGIDPLWRKVVEKDIDGVRVVADKKKHTNASDTRNTGILRVWDETDVFAFLDADDRYEPEKIRKSLDAFSLSPLVCCVVSDYINHQENGREFREYKPSYESYTLLDRCTMNMNCLVTKDALAKVTRRRMDAVPAGGATAQLAPFDPALRVCEDFDLFLRLAEVGIIYHIPEVLHRRTVRTDATSSAIDDMVEHETLVRMAAMARRGVPVGQKQP